MSAMSNIYHSTEVRPYVYCCTHKVTNKFYIGYREANLVPSTQDLPIYRTSSIIVNPDFDNYDWVILAEFKKGDDAYDFEQQLIYNSLKEELLINKSCYYGKRRFNASVNRKSLHKFIEEANEKHNNKYSYEKVEYKNACTKVIITCPCHGDFQQIPADHLFGKGCIICSKKTRGTRNIERAMLKFLRESAEKHNNKFTYNLQTFVNMVTPMEITCHKHGKFMQVPDVHRRSMYACPECLSEYRKQRWEDFRAGK